MPTQVQIPKKNRKSSGKCCAVLSFLSVPPCLSSVDVVIGIDFLRGTRQISVVISSTTLLASDVIKPFFKQDLNFKTETKTKCSRPRLLDPRPRLSFLSSRRLKIKTLVSRTTSLSVPVQVIDWKYSLPKSTSCGWEGKGRYVSFRLRMNVWVCG